MQKISKLIIVLSFSMCSSLATAEILSSHIQNFIGSRGGVDGCLLSGAGTTASTNEMALMITKSSDSIVTYLKESASGSCSLGPNKYHCINVPLSDLAVNRLKNFCNRTRCSQRVIANCEIWGVETSLEKNISTRFDPSKHLLGKSGNEAAFLIGHESNPGLAPLTLVTKNGMMAEIISTTSGIRNIDPDVYIDLASSFGVRVDDIQWLGIESLIARDYSSKLFFYKKYNSGVIKKELASLAEFEHRLKNIFNSSVFSIEKFSVANLVEIREILILSLLDDYFESEVLKENKFTFHPAVYLYK